MTRTFLARGDRAGSAVITEGLDSVTCSNPPPAVHIATLGMKTYCSRCKQEGYIAPRGPRRLGTGPNGKQWALSGDINICGCNPPPVFYPARERHMTMRFTAEEAAALMAPPGGSATKTPATGIYNEQFTLTDYAGQPLASVRYRVRVGSNVIATGVTDSRGRTQRVRTDGVKQLCLEVAA